jgi:uncharacterized membrane protein
LAKVTPDRAVEAMTKSGGTVLTTSLSQQNEQDLQDTLHGGHAAAQRSPHHSRGRHRNTPTARRRAQ